MKFEKWTGARQRLPDRRGRGAALGADPGADQADLRPALRGRLRRDPAAARRSRTQPTSPSCGSSTPTAPRRSSPETAPARRRSTCAAAGWTDADEFTILTKAGPITPTIRSERECTLDMGRREHQLAGLPVGRRRRPRRARGRRGAPGASSTSRSATRSARSRSATSSRPSTWPRSARRSSTTSSSRTAPTSASSGSTREIAGAGPDLRARGGGDALLGHRRQRRGGGRLPGRRREPDHASGSTAGELEVEVSDELDVRLTGWAEPVYAGELSPEFMRVLGEAPLARPPSLSARWPHPRRRRPDRSLQSAWRRSRPYMFAELERRIEAKRDAGHRRDQPRDRRSRHADLPLRRRGDAGGGRRPGHAEVPEQPRAPGVPRGVRGLLPAALRGRDRRRERGDPGDRGQGVHLQPLLRLPRSRRRRPRLGSRLPGLHRRAGARRRRGRTCCRSGRTSASPRTSTRSRRRSSRRRACSSSTTRTTRPARSSPTASSSAWSSSRGEHEILVVHDNAYSETTYDGYVAPSFLATPGAKEVGVEVFSLSKGYNMTGWRCAAILGNAEAIKTYWRLKTNVDSGLFEAVQLAGAAALRGPRKEVEEMCRIYERRRDLVVEALRRHRRRGRGRRRARSTSGRRSPTATPRPRSRSWCSRRRRWSSRRARCTGRAARASSGSR